MSVADVSSSRFMEAAQFGLGVRGSLTLPEKWTEKVFAFARPRKFVWKVKGFPESDKISMTFDKSWGAIKSVKASFKERLHIF